MCRKKIAFDGHPSSSEITSENFVNNKAINPSIIAGHEEMTLARWWITEALKRFVTEEFFFVFSMKSQKLKRDRKFHHKP